MPPRHPESSGSTIVLVGSFNPNIFQPEWFARQGLLPEPETGSAEIKIIVPQISSFETERFFLQVTAEQFSITSKPNSNAAFLSDLVRGTFFILEHTPVTAMGLNFSMHFAMESEEAWHRIGDRLAPKDGWNEILEGRPGLLSMLIKTERVEWKGSLFHIKVEPSIKVKHGVYFETNEHYPAPETEPLTSLMAKLGDRWEGAQSYAASAVNHILEWAIKEQ